MQYQSKSQQLFCVCVKIVSAENAKDLNSQEHFEEVKSLRTYTTIFQDLT